MAAPGDRGEVRVRLLFEYPPPALPQSRHLWFMLDTGQCRAITDVTAIIRERFFYNHRGALSLYLDGCLLPPGESVRLIRDNDAISVKWEDSPQHGGLHHKKREEEQSEDSRAAREEEPKKKKKKRMTSEDEEEPKKKKKKKQRMTSEDEEEPKKKQRMTSEDEEEPKKKKKKKQRMTSEDEEEPKKKQRMTSEDEEEPKKKKQQRMTSEDEEEPKKKKKQRMTSEDEEDSSKKPRVMAQDGDSSKKPKKKVVAQDEDSSKKPRAVALDEDSSKKPRAVAQDGDSSMKPKKKVMAQDGDSSKKPRAVAPLPDVGHRLSPLSVQDSERKSKKHDPSFPPYQKTPPPSSSYRKKESISSSDIENRGGQGRRVEPGPPLRMQQSADSSSPEGHLLKPLRSGHTPSPPACNGHVTGRGAQHRPLLRTVGRGAERGRGLHNQPPRGRGFCGRGEAKLQNHFFYNYTPEDLKEQQLSEDVSHMSVVVQNPPEVPMKDYSALPLLAAPPQPGNVLAFKLLELTENYTPEISDYKEGRVLSYDPVSQQLEVEILSQQKRKEPGKFDLVYEGEDGTGIVEYAVPQDCKEETIICSMSGILEDLNPGLPHGGRSLCPWSYHTARYQDVHWSKQEDLHSVRGCRSSLPSTESKDQGPGSVSLLSVHEVRSPPVSTMAQSLEEMAEELTCSICLSVFSTPVTLPCGHNFCSQCLDLSWKGVQDAQYSCPQCRYVFSSKPELRKNTLLSNLVSQVMAARREDPDHQVDDLEDETPDSAPNKEAVLCDSCRKEAASKTCLTCMASFCQEHLMPHLQSPAFLDHLLSQPLRDLKERKCAEHNKLMDHYCWEHGQCLCAYCALGHKTCRTYTLREAKHQKELHYTNMLRSVNQKIEKAANTAEEVKSEQRRLLENIRKKKELLEAEFEEMKHLIEEEHRAAMAKIEEEERRVTSKFSYTQSVLAKKRQEYERMSSRVQSLLQEHDHLTFLKRAAKLKDTTSKEPYKPKTEFDEKLLQNIFKNAVSLKEMIKSSFWQTAETPEYKRQPKPGTSGAEPMSGADEAGRWKNPAPPKPEEKPNKNKLKVKKVSKSTGADDSETTPQQKTQTASGARAPDPRETLLMSAEQISADPRTVHKKIVLSASLTRLSVGDRPQDYPEDPRRFVSCSQLLCSQGFSQGVHYWEVLKEGGHFSGLGVAYQSIARSGAESRLGRNKMSWCVEWCNGKLAAWHDDKQTDLPCPGTARYGVLLDCGRGFVSFHAIGKKSCSSSEIYRFRARFSEPLYPAFWIFSSHTSLTLNAFNMEP